MSKIVRICTYEVYVAERVVNIMVTGNLDYCTSLRHGITLDYMLTHTYVKKIRSVSECYI